MGVIFHLTFIRSSVKSEGVLGNKFSRSLNIQVFGVFLIAFSRLSVNTQPEKKIKNKERGFSREMAVNYSKIFDRMLKAGGLKNGSQLAKALGVSPQAVSNYKKRGELPASLIFKFAEAYSVSIDWLLTGVGNTVQRTELAKLAYAHETDEYYSIGKPECPSSINDLMMLTPDEIIYVGRLLKVLRGPEKYVPALKVCIDSFIKAADKSTS